MKNLKINSKKIIAGMCLFGVIFTISPLPSYAITAEEAQTSVQDYIAAPKDMIYPDECKETLLKGNPSKKIRGFEPELVDFMKFLDENFKNKSSTSSLAPLAIARYREYRDALRKQFKHVQTSGSKLAEEKAQEDGSWSLTPFEDSVKSYAICEEMVNTYISLGRQELLRHIKTSSAQKKTIMLLEKYKAMNAKLRGLNMKIAEMFSLFVTFKNKFPGYVVGSCMK